MISEVEGNIFESEDQILVNEVNCDGSIDNTLTYEYKLRNGYMFLDYEDWCKTGCLKIGNPILHRGEFPNILCFPTKTSCDSKSSLENFQKGLDYVVDNWKKMNIKSISFPMLCTYDGGISSETFLETMYNFDTNIQDIAITIYRNYIPSRDKELISFLDYVNNSGPLDGVGACSHNRLANIISDNYNSIYSLRDILQYHQPVIVNSGQEIKQSVFESDLIQAFASFREKTR